MEWEVVSADGERVELEPADIDLLLDYESAEEWVWRRGYQLISLMITVAQETVCSDGSTGV